jgi:bacteriorhodopsin
MNFLVGRDNDALEVNPQMGDRQLSVNGSSWLWAVTAVFLLSFLLFFLFSLRPRHNERIFHYIFATALIVGAISYYAMASGLGYVVISQANQVRRGLTRQIFWPKYVYWTVSFPAAILALGILSGVSWATIFYSIALSWVWTISYLVAAFTPSNYKWGFFALGTLAWFVLLFGSLTDGRRNASRVGIGRHYTLFTAHTFFFWMLYPIAWGLSDGGNVIGVTESFIFFGILDILFLPVMAFLMLFLSKKWDYERLSLRFTQHGRGHTLKNNGLVGAGPHHGDRNGATAAPVV